MLKDFKIFIEYIKDGIISSCTDLSCADYEVSTSYNKGRLQVMLTAKNAFELSKANLLYNYNYKKDSKVFCNGYQSWSYSREYANGEKFSGLKSIAKYPPVKSLAYTCGDYHFVNYSTQKGHYHSSTYGYIRNGQEFALLGSLSEKVGFTTIRYDFAGDTLQVEKDVEGKAISAQEKIVLFDIYYEAGDYESVFDNYFKLMELKLPAQKRLCGYTSWYNYFGNSRRTNFSICLQDSKI